MKPAKNKKPHPERVLAAYLGTKRPFQCSQKLVFKGMHEALVWAKRKEREYGVPTRFYKCPHCYRYHLTTRISREEKMEKIFNFKL